MLLKHLHPQPEPRTARASSRKTIPGPRRILIRLLSACNLHCHYCWDHSSLTPGPALPAHMVDLNTVKNILDSAARWGTEKIILSGNGEPTLHPDFDAIVAYADKKRLALELLTNGTFPLKQLPLMARIKSISVNLSAANKNAYKRLQHPNAPHLFDNVITNLGTLARMHQKYRQPELHLVFIVTRPSYPHIPDILALAKNMGIPSVLFKRFSPTPATRSLSLTDMDHRHLTALINEQLLQSWPLTHNLGNFQPPLKKSSRVTHIACLAGWTELSVEADKRVGFCCCTTSDLYVGDLKTNSLEEIWYGSAAERLRNYCRSGINLKKHPRCRECPPYRYDKLSRHP